MKEITNLLVCDHFIKVMLYIILKSSLEKSCLVLINSHFIVRIFSKHISITYIQFYTIPSRLVLVSRNLNC